MKCKKLICQSRFLAWVENIKLSKTAIDNNIDKLKELGILERRGSDRGGSWKIIYKRSIGG